LTSGVPTNALAPTLCSPSHCRCFTHRRSWLSVGWPGSSLMAFHVERRDSLSTTKS
jgi:hypothetical protein